MMNGFIRVPVSKVQRALRFAEQYSTKYAELNEQVKATAYEKVITPLVGTRSLKRAFYLVPMSKREAEAHAYDKLTTYGSTNWPAICQAAGANYAEVKARREFLSTVGSILPQLKNIFDAGHHLDYILLDLESCSHLQHIIQLAEKERFA